VAINGHGRLREGNYLYGSFGCDFQTAEGQRVMIVALTERHWRNLVELTGMKDAIEALERSLGVDLGAEEVRYRYREVLAALIRPWFEQATVDEVTTGLEASQVLWGTYRTVEEFVTHPKSLLHQSPLVSEVHQPGIGTFPTPRSVLDITGVTQHPQPAPILGEHTDEVLRVLLHLDESRLRDLHERRVIGGGRR
jgi:2-methylfumaryl-CoA isomerase